WIRHKVGLLVDHRKAIHPDETPRRSRWRRTRQDESIDCVRCAARQKSDEMSAQARGAREIVAHLVGRVQSTKVPVKLRRRDKHQIVRDCVEPREDRLGLSNVQRAEAIDALACARPSQEVRPWGRLGLECYSALKAEACRVAV